ncbi:Protein CBG22237 [Caenorhabditis briggsae]|uniref:Protein CBG22237 n=1 Tax=Caenorhabditis briggsae TaxID=6238 RepID=A8Y1V1_CAEBR|nr:Protein CBG22237 [Caenorhabditis briggsae]CAP38871.2 Protein CBG22237 [Caenorhabditis briggsae]
MTTPKKSSNCGKRDLSKMTDLGKWYKKVRGVLKTGKIKIMIIHYSLLSVIFRRTLSLETLYALPFLPVERIKNRLFHGERVQSTFVPSAQQQQQLQNSATQSTSSAGSTTDPQMPHQPVLINPPYPVHPGFGTGFPQYQYPQQQHHQPVYPPSYGWALNSAAAAAAAAPPPPPPPPQHTDSSSSFSLLSLDVGVGNETAGSGYDHLIDHHHDDGQEPSYLRPDAHEISELRKAQSAKLEKVKQRMVDEVTSLNFVINDVKELEKWYDDNYPYTLVKDDAITTEELEERVRKMEEKLRKLRAKSPGGRPIRPPKPRSYSQENSTSPWTCDRCHVENQPFSYRCKKCHLPSRRFDPSEIEFCGCEHCSTAATNST